MIKELLQCAWNGVIMRSAGIARGQVPNVVVILTSHWERKHSQYDYARRRHSKGHVPNVVVVLTSRWEGRHSRLGILQSCLGNCSEKDLRI